MNAELFQDAAFARAESGIARARAAALELLEELVRIPTVNPPGAHYMECALLLAQRLRDLGLDPRLVEIPRHELEHLGLDPSCPRPSVIATIAPSGHPPPTDEARAASGGESEARDSAAAQEIPTLHFHGHYDVVPVQTSTLFSLRVNGDYAYGRGTADMKGGLVSIFLAAAALMRLRARLRGRVVISFVPDEETGGAAGTEYLLRSGALPSASLGMLMPEPTGGVVWNGNRGALSLQLTVHGRMAHVALQHRGRNAFEGLLELGQLLRELKQEVEGRRFAGEDLGLEGPPSILLIGGTCHGGMNFNVVPEAMTFTIDRRFHPAEPLEAAERELEALLRRFRRSGWKLETKWLQRGEASLTPRDAPLVAAVTGAIESLAARPTVALCPGILESRFFLRHRTPGIAYGPGELEVSHSPTERVAIGRLLEVARTYARTAWAMIGPDADPPAPPHETAARR